MSYGISIGRNHTADGMAYLAGYGDQVDVGLEAGRDAPAVCKAHQARAICA